MEKSEKRTFGNREFSLSLSFSIISAFLAFAFSFLAAKYLESSRYGQIQYYLSLVSLLGGTMVFGADNFIIKNIQFAINKKIEMSRFYFFLLITSLATLPIYFLIAYFCLGKLGHNIGLIFLIFGASLVCAGSSFISAFFTGINKNELRILITAIVPHCFFLILFGVCYFTNTLGFFVTYYLYFYLGIYGIMFVLFFCFTFRFSKIRFSKQELKTIFLFALIWISYSSISPIANILIGEKYEAFGVVGIFSISTQLLSVAEIVSGVITNISLPLFSKMVKEGNHEGLYKYYSMVTRINMYVGVPFYIAFACESQKIMAFFGDSYTGFDLIIVLLSITSAVECFTGPCGSVLMMGGKEKENLFASLARFVVYIGLTALLIQFTIYAAPIAMLASSVVGNSLKLFFLWKFEHKNFFSKDIYLPLFVITIICAAVFVGLGFIPNKIVWAISNAIAGVALIMCFIMLTPYKGDREFFKKDKSYLQTEEKK
jgi:O-antigen/teichoic acid export membrane protein